MNERDERTLNMLSELVPSATPYMRAAFEGRKVRDDEIQTHRLQQSVINPHYDEHVMNQL